ncbi:hypothetical protein OAS39_00805 [Pirellulales bacterium]|nr:hypothetical protein [Pirellulales bacterium]
MNSKLIALISTLVGLSLVGLSYLWPQLDDGRGTWTEEKALRYIELGEEVHKLTFKVQGAAEPRKMHGGNAVDGDEFVADRKRLEAALQEATELKAELDGVRESNTRRPALFKWIGLGLAGAGVVALMVIRGDGAN